MTEREYYREETTPADPNQPPTVREQVHLTPDTASGSVDSERHVIQEHSQGPDGTRTTLREQVYQPSVAQVEAVRSFKIQQIVYFIVGAIAVLLAVRFVLLLFAANNTAPFVNFMYTITQPFVYPFQGIFGEPVFGASVVEWASLVAIAVYMLIGAGIVKLVNIARRPTINDL